MDAPKTPPRDLRDATEAARHLALLGWSAEAAKTYASFHAGIRWPRPSDFSHSAPARAHD